VPDTQRTVVRAIRSADVPVFLGLSAERGQCLICGSEIVGDGIGGFVKTQGQLRLFCDRPDCLAAAESGLWTREEPEVPDR
jgi:hypothetical protein